LFVQHKIRKEDKTDKFMAKKLLIVESPAKARTIKKYLGRNFEVKASVGHVVDLPTNRLGVDISAGFVPEYQVIKKNEMILRDFKNVASKSEEIYLALDPDREGEAIAWHIVEQLGGTLERFHRVLFYELTKNAIDKAVAHPTCLNHDLYDSQQARRILDRLVGYQISPLLWDNVRRGLSAGRVQSVALRLVVEREKAIFSFIPQEFWTVTADFCIINKMFFSARLVKLLGTKFEPKTENEALAGVALVKKQTSSIIKKIVTQKKMLLPSPPFITSTLQQEASRRLGMTPRETMSIAQKLYEGQETDQGTVGLITYMRTDSTRLADEAIKEVRNLICHCFGKEYVPKQPFYYISNGFTQSAHEAIRPTSVFCTPNDLIFFLKKKELSLYRLIYNRFVACQIAPALYSQTLIDIEVGATLFKASGQRIIFDGFTVIYSKNHEELIESIYDDENNKTELALKNLLPSLKQGQKITLKSIKNKQHFTQPLPRFTEASLVKELENKDVGRPSTYAVILSALQDKEYITKSKKNETVSLAKQHLVPTSLGMIINDLLVKSFPQIMEVDFTAGIEKALDQVEAGSQNWRAFLKDFYDSFIKALKLAQKNMLQIKGKGFPTGMKCPTCGVSMSIRLSKHGEFLACDAYPKCKTTSDFTRDDKGVLIVTELKIELDNICKQCGSFMKVKRSRYGSFLACTSYPKCKNIQSLQKNNNEFKLVKVLNEQCPKCNSSLIVKITRVGGRFISCISYPKCNYARGLSVGVSCPTCGDEIVEKSSRIGKIFFGCGNYPMCKFAIWDRPINSSCPQCNHPFLLKKYTRQGMILQCPVKNCNYLKE